jgi:hypothetical protein
MVEITRIVGGVADDPLNMDYHEWEVTIHSDHDRKIIRCPQQFDETCFSRAKPTNGLQHEGCTKLERIFVSSEEGRWKEVMFTQVQLVAESAHHKRCDCTNTLVNQDIYTWIKR